VADESRCVRGALGRVPSNRIHNTVLRVYRPLPSADRLLWLGEEHLDYRIEFATGEGSQSNSCPSAKGAIDFGWNSQTLGGYRRSFARLAFRTLSPSICDSSTQASFDAAPRETIMT
jgi:hypothetical protein